MGGGCDGTLPFRYMHIDAAHQTDRVRRSGSGRRGACVAGVPLLHDRDLVVELRVPPHQEADRCTRAYSGSVGQLDNGYTSTESLFGYGMNLRPWNPPRSPEPADKKTRLPRRRGIAMEPTDNETFGREHHTA